MMRVSFLLKIVGVVALVILAACGKQPVTRPGLIFLMECEVIPGSKKYADTVTVALLDAVDPGHAPRARNAGERLVFHHFYETLITVDCLGHVRPGLADSWISGKGDRRWTFGLREGAEFWDGTPVTAHDVARSWRRAMVDPASHGIDSISVADDRVLHVHFTRRHRKAPRVFSAPAFAVAKPSWISRWPLGSGPYRVEAEERGFSAMPRRMITAHPAFGADGPVIRFVETSMHDARDLLEGAVDVMITADPVVIEYATGRPELATIALLWDRTYVLLSTSRIKELQRGSSLGAIPPDLADRLAQDAVRGDARGYRPPSWWEDLYRCGDLSAAVAWFPPVPGGARPSSGPRRLLYNSSDPIARDLAGRIVALAETDPTVSAEAAAIIAAVPGLMGDNSGLIADGVTRSELDLSLRDGDDFAYVIQVPRLPPDPCHEAYALINRARWLATFEVDFSEAFIPLVDTRRHVIVNSSRVGLIVDWYGNILITNEMLQGDSSL